MEASFSGKTPIRFAGEVAEIEINSDRTGIIAITGHYKIELSLDGTAKVFHKPFLTPLPPDVATFDVQANLKSVVLGGSFPFQVTITNSAGDFTTASNATSAADGEAERIKTIGSARWQFFERLKIHLHALRMERKVVEELRELSQQGA